MKIELDEEQERIIHRMIQTRRGEILRRVNRREKKWKRSSDQDWLENSKLVNIQYRIVNQQVERLVVERRIEGMIGKDDRWIRFFEAAIKHSMMDIITGAARQEYEEWQARALEKRGD